MQDSPRREPTATPFRVTSEPTVRITVYDSARAILAEAEGRLAVVLPPGIYRVHFERGGVVESQLVDHDQATDLAHRGPPMRSPVPFSDPVTSDDRYRELAIRLSTEPASAASGNAPADRLLVFIRRMDRDAGRVSVPSEPITIHDARGRPLATISASNPEVECGDRYAACARSVRPGVYRLRAVRSRREVAITIPPGRSAHVFVPDTGRVQLDQLRVSLVPTGSRFDPDSPLWTAMEVVIAALRVPGRRLPEAARALLPEAADADLCFGIAAAHVLWRSGERDAVAAVMARLAAFHEVPDVAILERAWRPQLTGVPEAPPLFHDSLVMELTTPALAAHHVSPITAFDTAASTRLDDSVWCTWSPRAWDRRWIEPTVNELRAHEPGCDAAAIALSLALPRSAVEDALRTLDAAPRIPVLAADRSRLVPGYALGRMLGRSAHSIVVEATRLADRESVALKIIAVDGGDVGCARALRAVPLRPLVHRRVITASESGPLSDSSGIWLEMELCRESLLDSLSNRDAPLVPGEARRIVLEALEGLAALHAAGTVHGAIHPANLLIRRDGSVAIADRSLVTARVRGDVAPARSAPRFVGPEALDPDATVTTASDVWSTAATLYFALTLELPRDEYAGQTQIDAARDNPTVPITERRADLPAELAHSIDRALSRDVRDRPGDADALRDRLGADTVLYAASGELIAQAELLYDYCFAEIPLETRQLPYEPRWSSQCKRECASLWVTTKSGAVMRIDLSTGQPQQTWFGGAREARTIYHQHDGRALSTRDPESVAPSFLLVGRDDGALDIIPDDHPGWSRQPPLRPSVEKVASFYLDAWWDHRDRFGGVPADQGVPSDGDDRDRYDTGVTAILVLDRPGAPGLEILVATRGLYLYVIEAAGGRLRLRERLAMPGWITWIIAPQTGDPRIAFVARSGDVVWRAQDQLFEGGEEQRAELSVLPTAALPFDGGSLLLGTTRGLYLLDAAHPDGIALPVTRSAVLCLDRGQVTIDGSDRDYITMGLDDGGLRVIETEVIRELAGIPHTDPAGETSEPDRPTLHNFSRELSSPVLALQTLRPAGAPEQAAYVAAVLRDHTIRLFHVTSQPAVQKAARRRWQDHVRRWFGEDFEHQPDERLAAELATAALPPPRDRANAWKYMLADVVLRDLRKIAPVDRDAHGDAISGLACRLTEGADRFVLQRLTAAMGELTATRDPRQATHALTARELRRRPPHVGLLLELSRWILKAVPHGGDRAWLGFIENHLRELHAQARKIGDDPRGHRDRARLVAWTRDVRKYILLGDTFATKRRGLEKLIEYNCQTGKYLDALIYQTRLAQRGYDVRWEYGLGEDVAMLHVVVCPAAWRKRAPLVVAVTAGGKLAVIDSASGERVAVHHGGDPGRGVTLLAPFGDAVHVQSRASAVVRDGDRIRIVIACTGDDAPSPGLAVIELGGTPEAVEVIEPIAEVECSEDANARVYAIEPLPGHPEAFVLGFETAGWPVGLLTRRADPWRADPWRADPWRVELTKDEAPTEGVEADATKPVIRSSLAPGKVPTRALAVAATDDTCTRYLAVAGSDDGLVRAISFAWGEPAGIWKLRRWDRMTDAVSSVVLRRHKPADRMRAADESLFSCYLGTAAGDTIALSILARYQAGAGTAVSPFGDYDAQPLWRDTLDGAVLCVRLWHTPELYGDNAVLVVATDKGRMCLYNHTRYPRKDRVVSSGGDPPPDIGEMPVSAQSNYYFRGMRFDRVALPDRVRALAVVDNGRDFVAAGPDGTLYMGRCVYLHGSTERDDVAEARRVPTERATELPDEMWARLRYLFDHNRHDEYFHDAPVDAARRDELKLALCDLIRIEGGAVSSYALHQRLLHHQPWSRYDLDDLRHAAQHYLHRLDPEQPAQAAQIKIVLKSLGQAFLVRHPRDLRAAILAGRAYQPEDRDRAAVVCEVIADYITRHLATSSPAAARLRITAIKQLLRVPTLLHIAEADRPGARIATAVEAAVATCLRDDERLVRIETLRALSLVLRNVGIMAAADSSAADRDAVIQAVFPHKLGSLEWLLPLILESLRRLPSFTQRTALVSAAWYLIAALLPLFRIFPDSTLALCDYLVRAGLGVEVVALCHRSLRGPEAARIRSRIAHLYLLPVVELNNGRDEFIARYVSDSPGHRAVLGEMDLPPSSPYMAPDAAWYQFEDGVMADRLTQVLHHLACMWRARSKQEIVELADPDIQARGLIGDKAAEAWNRFRATSVPNVPVAMLERVVKELAVIAELSERPENIPLVLECLAQLTAPRAANVAGNLALTAPIRTIVSGIVTEWRRALIPKTEFAPGDQVGGHILGSPHRREGTYSSVFEIGADRVMKVFRRWDDPDAARSFLAGARFVRELSSATEAVPYIVPISEDPVDGPHEVHTYVRAYVMPKYTGHLGTYLPGLHNRETTAVAWARAAAEDIGCALQLVHRRNRRHGDINATNILVLTHRNPPYADIRPKFALNDFDRISSPIDPPDGRPGQTGNDILPTSTGIVPRLLSLSYNGDPRNNWRQWADVVALSMVLYQMLTGKTILARGRESLREAIEQLERFRDRRLRDRTASSPTVEPLVQTLIEVFTTDNRGDNPVDKPADKPALMIDNFVASAVRESARAAPP